MLPLIVAFCLGEVALQDSEATALAALELAGQKQ
jgi:hypothetical protein